MDNRLLPKKYRVSMMNRQPVEVWAYSAEDAEYQVQMMGRSGASHPSYVTYVEPADRPADSAKDAP